VVFRRPFSSWNPSPFHQSAICSWPDKTLQATAMEVEPCGWFVNKDEASCQIFLIMLNMTRTEEPQGKYLYIIYVYQIQKGFKFYVFWTGHVVLLIACDYLIGLSSLDICFEIRKWRKISYGIFYRFSICQDSWGLVFFKISLFAKGLSPRMPTSYSIQCPFFLMNVSDNVNEWSCTMCTNSTSG